MPKQQTQETTGEKPKAKYKKKPRKQQNIPRGERKKYTTAGKPRKYNTPEEMQTAVNNYFREIKEITICGLSLYLGFACRQSLLDYEGYSQEYFDILKKAKCRVERYYEKHLVKGNPGGPIFALKQFKWKDKTETVHGVTDGFGDLLKEIGGRGDGLQIPKK